MLFSAAVSFAAACSSASAAIDTWIGSTGNWSDGTKWTDQKAPTSAETAVVNTMSGSAVTVNLDVSPNIAGLIIEATKGTMTFSQPSTTLSVSNNEYIGYDGPGSYSQSSGLNAVSHNIYIGGGTSASGSGVYSISDGTVTASVITIGGNTTGAVATGLLTVGSNSFSRASVNCTALDLWNSSGTGLVLKGGTLAAGTIIGAVPGSNFTWTSGTLSITGVGGFSSTQIPNLSVNTNQTLTATALNLTAGSLSLAGGSIAAGTINTTGNPSGFNWSSGMLALSPATGVPYTLSSSNLGQDFTLSAGKTLSVGTLIFSGTAFVPSVPAFVIPTGTSLTLNGGSLSVGTIDTTGNPGGFKWSSGTLSIIGTTASTYTLSSTNLGSNPTLASGMLFTLRGTLAIPANTSIALSGGTISANVLDLSSNPNGFTWTSGTLNVAKITGGSAIRIGPGQTLNLNGYLGSSSTGPITLDGGSIYAQSFDANPSGFVWNSGSLNFNSFFNTVTASPATIGLNLTLDPSKSITDNLGGIEFPQGSSLSVTGGSMSVEGLTLNGTTTINSGTIYVYGDLYVNRGETVGSSGAAATVTQNGGSNSLHGSPGHDSLLSVGTSAAYLLNAGSLRSDEESVFGTFNQSGGSNSVTGLTNLPPDDGVLVIGSNGSYALSNGSLTVTGHEFLGSGGLGTFIQTGGVHKIVEPTSDVSSLIGLRIGDSSPGLYSLSAGTLSIVGDAAARVPTPELIGGTASATFIQSGGLNSVAVGDIYISSNAGASYLLSGGNVSIQDDIQFSTGLGGNIAVGGSISSSTGGPGLLQITGGTFTATKNLKIWNTPNTGVILAGGSLSVGAIDTSGNPSRFSWSAGTLVITGSAGLDLSILGPSVSLGQNQALTVSKTLTVPAGQALTLNGGAASAGAVVVTGGSLIVNQGSFSTGSISLSSGAQMTLAGALPGGVLSLGALAIDGSSQLDIGGTEVVVNYTASSPAGAIRSLLITAYKNGAWNGRGIASSAAAGDISRMTGVGYLETVAQPTGLPSAISGAVIIKTVPYGDTNLDSVVDLTDFSRFVDGLAGLKNGWVAGDFNYDGVTDLADFSLFFAGFTAAGGQYADLSARIASNSNLSSAQKAQLVSLIPEPTGAAMALAGLFSLRRRRTVRR